MIDFGEPLPEKRHFDLTPLIDVVFQLLVFFLLTSIYSKPVIPVNLPEAVSGVVSEESDITVSIKSNSMIFLNNKPINVTQLTFDIKKMLEKRTDKSVFLFADQSVNFGFVIDIMDRTKQAGATSISVVTEKKPIQ